ncbi:MAG: single-stranded-DNA-specific exonuclease RecJ [Nitrospirota bacterium]
MKRRWVIPRVNTGLQSRLSQEARLSPVLAQVLINRGIETPRAVAEFLNPYIENLHDPFLLPDMYTATKRIVTAIKRNEKIVVYGDYDVDGITGTAILIHMLKDSAFRLGSMADCSYYIPHRLKEGYGLNTDVIKRIKSEGVSLIITVDCGTTAIDEVSLANTLGIDVIITDHHHVTDVLPPAAAVVNPNRKDSIYSFKELAGAGIVFKLTQALSSEFGVRSWEEYLDLAAIGTIADVVPLIGENRIIASEGLNLLTESKRAGIVAIKRISGIEGKTITSGMVGFIIAPRINAAGRLGDATSALKLLLTEDMDEAEELAKFLDARNKERQQIENEIFEKAKAMITDGEKWTVDGERYAIVLSSPSWHSGVIGIVASRLVEKFYRPAFLFVTQEGICKGSARSIPPFHICEGLKQIEGGIEIKFGGHSQAAGIKVKEEDFISFGKWINRIVRESLSEEDLIPKLKIDARVKLREINFTLIDELNSFSPFGYGNPEPLLGAKGLEVLYPKIVGNNHLKMKLRQDGTVFDAIGFDMRDALSNDSLGSGVWSLESAIGHLSKIDAAFTPQVNDWEGGKQIQINIKAIRLSQNTD